MTAAYADLVLDPATFFERWRRGRSAWLPLAAVGAVAVLSAAAFAVRWPLFAEAAVTYLRAAGDGPAFRAVRLFRRYGFAAGVLAAMFGAALAWLFYAAAFQALASLLGSPGGFRETVLVAGAGFAPRILALAVEVVGTWYVVGRANLPAGAGAEAPWLFRQHLAASPVYAAVVIAGIGALAWSGYIWFHGIRAVHGLDRRKALLVVGIPVVVALVPRLAALGRAAI